MMAEATSHFYETAIEWKGRKDLSVNAPGLPSIVGGAPPEFQGREGVWAPEHLFVASLNSCYVLALLAIAEFSKVPLVSCTANAKGRLEKVKGSGFQIVEIIVKPKVVLANASDLSRMPRILEKAKENCFVSNSIKTTIVIEPEIFHQQTPSSPCPLGSPDNT